MRRTATEDGGPDALGQVDQSDAQSVQQAQIAQVAQGGEGGRLEGVAGERAAGQQDECSGARGAEQARCVCVVEEGLEEGLDGCEGVEQLRVELSSDAR